MKIKGIFTKLSRKLIASFLSLLLVTAAVYNPAFSLEPGKWYYGSDLEIDEHIIFGEDRMYTEGKANRGFTYLLDNNPSAPFYISTNDTGVNYQDLTQNGKEISVTFHTSSPVVIDHFKIVSGGDTYKANYAHRSPTAWNLKAGNSLDSLNTVLAQNLPINATSAYEVNMYEFENTTPYKYYKFTITALAGAGRSGHDSPFSNPTATCILADIVIGGPDPAAHADHDNIGFASWDSATSLPTTAGNYSLSSDVTISSTWNVPSGTTNLCLNGHGIIRTNASGTTGSVIQVGSGATLNLYDCGTETGYYTVSDPTANGAGLGTVVEESVYNAAAENARGTFTGGYITGGVISGNADAQHLIGGGVNVDRGSFNMYGGTIIGNRVCINAGGVKVKGAGASFVMNGGAIIANYNDCYGGAISVGDNGSNRLCTLIINGGTIARNWSGRNGGALHFDGYKHTFIMTGGSIVNNYTNGNYENGSSGRSGGAMIDPPSLKLSGDPVIKNNTNGGNLSNNIHLRAEKTDVINLSGFSAGAEVGVYVKGLTASSDYKVMTGAQKADIQYLSYDIPDEAGVLYCDGAKDWVCVSGETVELTGTHHTHEAGTVWASAAANPAACVTADNTATAYSEFGGALTAWADGATLKLTKDVTVSSTVSVPSGNHTLDLNGYGLKMTGSGSVISVGNGAKLSINDSNPDTQHKFTVSDEKSNGAGLATVNDSLTSGYKTFKGGYITGGNADNGGGIYIDGYGEVIMNGGALIGNHAADNGAGIRMESYSSFTLNGGEIAYNQASVHGGGLGLAYTNHTTITVNGGEIHHNICEYAGGAITLDNDPDSYFYLYGGAIRDNASVSGSGNNPWHPGGIAGNGNVHIKGGAQVYNNINLSSSNNGTAQHNIEINTSENDLITLDGPLSEGARIAVSYHTGGEKATGVFTLNWSKYMGDADPADYFVSDYDEYIVRLNNGEAEHTLPPVASITSGESTANYSSFSDAVSAWTAGSTLKLMTDVTTGSTVSVPLGEHTLDLNGYGIKMTGSGSVISVPNGATLNLNDSNTSATHKFSLPDGAGLATLDESNGNYVISGGYITGGNAQPYGGGVFVAKSGILNMYGGTIIGNNASSHGGGVSASAAGQGVSSVANFKMFGGAISYNTANWGGGVAVYGNVYTYNNAVISANTASAGGGIELESNGKLYMNGGTVTENRLLNQNGGMWKGAGIHVPNGSEYHVSGNPVVKNNYQGSGATAQNNVFVRKEVTDKVIIDGALDNTAQIGVTLQNGSGIFTTGWKDKMGDADPANYFVSDNTDYIVTREGDEAIIRYPDLTGVSADDVKFDYDGKSHAITVTAPEGATVTYGTEEGEYSLSNSPAYTEAGTYTVYYKVSKDKFTPATGSATVTVEKIDVTVTVTGHTGSADYDACEHTVTGYDVTASNALYDVTNDFTFGGTASVSGTNAGTYNMGLKAEQFTNTNPNFKTVTFNVTDGYVTVNPIDVTVTVTGHTVTADYNGNAHSADGYDAEFSTDLYSRSDFIYNGRAEAVRTDAGTTAMGLKTELFENKNDNFSSVTFVVTDGYVTVNTVDAVIITAPISVRPVYSGSMIDLIAASEAEGGTVYYALGEDPRNAPADESFDTAIPKAKEIGSYYVWYKVVADSNHNDISPAYVKVVLAEDDWVILSGVLYESDGKTPIGDSVVTLTKGNEKIDYVITDSLGNYEFTVPTGTYNIVAEGHGVSSTELVKVFKNTSRNFKMSAGKTESIVKVTDNENGNSGITVGGLSSEAYYIRESEKIDDETNVSVLITVETKADNTAENSGAFSTLMRRKSFVFFDVKLEKTIGSKTTSLNKTANVMEIAVPYEKINRRGLSVYNADGDTIRTFKEASTGEDGTYSIDKENGFVYIYTNKFSTFAIGYVPYYKVESNVSLGSFEGNATVILEGQNGEGDYKLEDVDLSEISFADIPKGEYKMTVTWEDGATNTLTMPLAVS